MEETVKNRSKNALRKDVHDSQGGVSWLKLSILTNAYPKHQGPSPESYLMCTQAVCNALVLSVHLGRQMSPSRIKHAFRSALGAGADGSQLRIFAGLTLKMEKFSLIKVTHPLRFIPMEYLASAGYKALDTDSSCPAGQG